MEKEREKEMNEPLAFRNELATARKTALEHARLSAEKVLQAIECARLGKNAHQVLSLIPKGRTGYVEQQRVVRAQFDTVNLLVTEVRGFIMQAKNGQVDDDNKSLKSMRLHLRTIDGHMKMLHTLTNN